MTKVIVLRLDDEGVCTPEATEIESTLDALQSIVGGLIEAVVVDDAMHAGTVMYINEEGLLESLPVNRLACELAWVPNGRYPLMSYALVGNAVVLGSDEHGDMADCPAWVYVWFNMEVPA